ncbi:hypothetical protein FJV41_46655 [Myxococcus llanfairpwllgwyngyllgogerychwyrndrobwllllantysiliogogogochensis]|uniref:Uncharacterized protein n=1 Tax=Myxococcus llanfairpwllgwyngyllgogerychwyrndrobwllllantysiliogogogochensis TaxID=2590453 RepID=A0A540WJ80_9BACT|nr:hypothetical protein [Myxococcus llanfairpwllgwyngyllgogerychwyrndrobwllllantysiliogogogochensis]TQF09051.1 hypothetical protein FJV41_46655 [Myxococcus llanfairpwllgwyngyllgogerychwyrndrobwllllantysiliogogogochensis]
MLDPCFSYESFAQTRDQTRLSCELEQVLAVRLKSAAAPDAEGHRIATELRALGHDLWSFDESTDFQIWCGDWKSPKHPGELTVTISYRDEEPRSVSVAFLARKSP